MAGEAMEAELTLDELVTLFEDIVVLEPQKVVFTGGEPLMRVDLFEITKAFRRIAAHPQIHLCLMSNGSLINEEIAAKVAESFNEIRISVDGPSEINNKLRGNGAFETAMKAVRYLRNAGIVPSVSITLSSLNLPSLINFLSFLFDEMLITDFHLTPFRPVGRGAKCSDLICSWKDAQLIVADFWQKRFGDLSGSGNLKGYKLVDCGNCGIGSHINIQPNGSVYPCHVLSAPEFLLGNLRQINLTEIVWESTILKQLQNLDFIQLAEHDDRLNYLFKDAICMGEVYRDAPELFVKK